MGEGDGVRGKGEYRCSCFKISSRYLSPSRQPRKNIRKSHKMIKCPTSENQFAASWQPLAINFYNRTQRPLVPGDYAIKMLMAVIQLNSYAAMQFAAYG